MSSRLDIRLDAEHRRKLDELAESSQLSISDLIRRLLDREHANWLRSQRTQAVEAIGRLSVEDVPEPDVLAEQLSETYEIPLH